MENISLSSSSRSRPMKRGATEAGMDDPHTLARRLHEVENKYTTLKRQFVALQGVDIQQKDEIQDLRGDLELLRQQRSSLVDGNKEADSLAEKNEKAWEEERMETHRQNRELSTRYNRTRDENELLKSECTSLSARLSQLEASTSSELASLRDRLVEVQDDRDGLKKWQRRAESLSIELEELKRRNEYRREDTAGGQGQGQDQDVEGLKKELKTQRASLTHFSTRLHQAETELVSLRKEKKEWLASRQEQKETEANLRNDVRILHDQLDRARRDMDSLTQSFPSDTEPTESASSLQAKLTSMSTLHHQATAEIAAKDTEINQLHNQHVEYVNTSRLTIAELTKRNTQLDRDLRWANQGRESAENREALVRKELENADGHNVRSMPGGLNSGDSVNQVRRLQALVEEYKAELDRTARDSRDLESTLAEGAGFVKASLLEEAQSRIAALETNISTLESTIAQLTSANTALDAEVSDLMRRVASGEYNTRTERVIELKDNPASRVLAVRTQVLDDLKKENEALLARITSGATNEGEAEGGGAVPTESWERLVKEKTDLEASHAKRLMRLKEIFGSKSKEFLEAVYSLLGWRIKFDESGTDIRLTSMYAPKGKLGLTLKFSSQEGHFGTMQMTGGMARGLEESRRFWIEERQSVPGFLAQVTTEMFEKTTIGRAAGYVGLE